MEHFDVALVDWSRAQFALTAIYHWFFVPLTLGLSFIVAYMHTIYYKTRDEKWKNMDASLADALMNKYYGLAEVYDLKLQKAWDTFEIVCREYHAARRASKQTYGVEHESD